MRTPIIAGNWKMNKTAVSAVEFVNEIKAALDAISGIDKAVCPPFLAIPGVAAALAGSSVGVGAQNMHFEPNGAYTGEVAADMLTPFCQYVILGHSERREYFAETDEGVNRKIKVALAHGLTPIVCVGESLAQNEAGETVSFVSGQVQAAFAGLSAADAAKCVVAYEPIWAIGTGRSASAQQAGDIIATAVRQPLAALFGHETAQKIRIQYGGSVKPGNIADYMAHPDIDGALVGGASLVASFVELVQNAV
ncbi:MAG: triose-phosphate isomerase [Chloroflexota bacterium]